MVDTLPQRLAGAPTRILIVEDEGIIATHIASRLSKTGYEVAGIAESSEQALAMVHESLPELILMDIRIKGNMDGIATTAKLRESFDIPVIYLTAHTDQQTIDRAKHTGAFGFLTKPIHHTSLATSIEMAIHKHRADQEARRQRAWMTTVLGAMPTAMVVLDRDRHIRFLNPPAEELTGWSDSEANGLDVARLLPLGELRAGNLPSGLIATARSGRRFPVEGEIADSLDEGRFVGSVVTFRDATTRLERESELRHEHKMQAVGQLAAGIAHDFNNLLFIILGYTEDLLRVSATADPRRRQLNEIRKAGEDAAGITQQLLKFSRNEPVEKRDISLNDAVRDSEETLRRLVGPAVRISVKLHPELGVVHADLGQMKQVLLNLAVNARDAMPEGGNLTIETANVDVPRPMPGGATREAFVSMTVTDTGVGMSPETAQRLFEPFFTTKPMGHGTGLGLSIVHSIVTDLGGSIHVESQPGDGAVFTLYIPRAGRLEATPPAEAALSGDPETQPTVLLAEDHEGVRILLREYLANYGCTVLEAENGEDAIRLAADHPGPIDLLITDVVMPKASGFDVSRAIAQKRQDIRTIFISGYAEELMTGRETLPASSRFLPKPFVQKELLRHIGDLLGQTNRLARRTAV